jgi:hypothetical protein
MQKEVAVVVVVVVERVKKMAVEAEAASCFHG